MNNLKGKALVNLPGGLPLTDTSVMAAMRVAIQSISEESTNLTPRVHLIVPGLESQPLCSINDSK